MNTTIPKHQPRWRITEQTVAELELLRRQGHHRSWETLFQTLIQRGQQTQPAKSDGDALHQRMGSLENKQDLILAMVENHENALQAVQQELKETLEAVRRIANTLSRAMAEQT